MGEFGHVLINAEGGGDEAVKEFAELMEHMNPISSAAQALTSMAIREDIGAVATLGLRYPKELFETLKYGQILNEPFGNIMKEMNIKNKFVRNWLDMLCFLLQGLPAEGTMSAVMAYMLADWYRPGVTLDFPKGGSGAIVQALVRGVTKTGYGEVCVNSHVDEIIVSDDGTIAKGVKLRPSKQYPNGKIIMAKEGVVSNADPYITSKLLHNARVGGKTDLKSFIHIHAGIDATGLPTEASADFPTQWAVVRDWDAPEGVESPRNIVLCSMPSLIDPTLAPEWKHVLHA